MNTITHNTRTTEAKVVWVIIAWALVSFYAGLTGLFTQMPHPIFGVVVIAIQTALIVAYFVNVNFQQFSSGFSFKTIALFHAWRIFAGWIFLAHSNQLPEMFINNAAYGDIVSGFLGLSVFVFGLTKLNHYIFNLVGLADFFLAVDAGLYLTFSGEPKMESIIHLPLIMIPMFGVPLSGYTHFLAFMKLSSLKSTRLLEAIN